MSAMKRPRCCSVISFIQVEIRPLVPKNGKGTRRLTVTREIRRGYILDGDLLEEGGFLAARISTHHSGLLQPLTQPGQVTITHIGVGQEVTMETMQGRDLDSIRVTSKGYIEYSQGWLQISSWLITATKVSQNSKKFSFFYLNVFSCQ